MITIRSNRQAITLELNRPERGNSLGLESGALLRQELSEIAQRLAIWEESGFSAKKCPGRALVIDAALSGKNKDVWIAGGDLRELSTIDSGDGARAYIETIAESCDLLASMPIPVIAKVTGKAIGGGLEFALAADIRLGGPQTEFHFKQMGAGLALGYRSSYRLVGTIGSAKALNLLLLQARLTGSELSETGLIQRLFPSRKSLDEGIEDLIESITKLDPKSVAVQKRMLRTAEVSAYEVSQRADADLFAGLWRNPTHVEFLKSFSSRTSANKNPAKKR